MGEDFFRSVLVSRTGNIPGFSGINGETKSHQLGIICINTGGFSIKTYFIMFFEFAHQFFNGGVGFYSSISMGYIINILINSQYFFFISCLDGD